MLEAVGQLTKFFIQKYFSGVKPVNKFIGVPDLGDDFSLRSIRAGQLDLATPPLEILLAIYHLLGVGRCLVDDLEHFLEGVPVEHQTAELDTDTDYHRQQLDCGQVSVPGSGDRTDDVVETQHVDVQRASSIVIAVDDEMVF